MDSCGAPSEEDVHASRWSSSGNVVCNAYQAPLGEQVRAVTGITPDLLDRGQVAQAYVGFVDAVNQGTLLHGFGAGGSSPNRPLRVRRRAPR